MCISPPPLFFCFFDYLSSKNKIYILNQVVFESKFNINNSWKFEVAKVTWSWPFVNCDFATGSSFAWTKAEGKINACI